MSKKIYICAYLFVAVSAAWAQNISLGAPVALPQISTPAPIEEIKYEVSPSDINMRRVLSKWSKVSGWTFAPEHWAVPRDIPISGSAAFMVDYKDAVRQLLASTSMSDVPVQPCFYANNVLRVIPASELCSRSEN